MTAATTKKKAPVNSLTAPSPANMLSRVRALNRWRENFNPAQGLTIARARLLFESYARGEFADLMWTYGAPMMGIECADADLLALIERRTSAVLEMDWEIKQVDPKKFGAGFDKKLSDAQAAKLRETYEGIDNVHDALEHLCLASFRGFSHLEKITNADGDLVTLAVVDQWNIVRDGLRGQWKYNPDARQTNFIGLGDDMLIDPESFIIREVARPVNRFALLKSVRSNLCEKDWDAFIEIYGLPSGVVILPPNVPQDKEPEFAKSATDIAQGGSGALPNGSEYKANDSPRGNNPFKQRLDHLTEKLILAGTGGLLTMLTQSGSGTLAGNAHADTFAMLARKEAAAISALLQRQLDASVLERFFPGQPALAYFDLCAEEEVDATAFVAAVASLAEAGYQVDATQITEKTGYNVTLKPAPAAPVPTPGKKPGELEVDDPVDDPADDVPDLTQMRNRAAARAKVKDKGPLERDPQYTAFLNHARQLFANATAKDLQPLRNALSQALKGDDATLPDRLRALRDKLPELAPQIVGATHAATELQGILSAAIASQLATTK